MQTIGLSLRARVNDGEPLPGVFKQLEDLGARIRRGQLTLVAAAPGGGKSLIATFIALHLKDCPSLYFSADSDKMTYGVRVMCQALDCFQAEAESLLTRKDEAALLRLDAETGHMWVDFNSSPSPIDIDSELNAFGLVYGEWPKLIVVDNLMDLSLGDIEASKAHDALLDYLKQLASRTGAAVVVLCHVTGAYTDGLEPIPRSGLMFKIDKRPRLVLTMHKYDENTIGVSVVKNSNGPASADGSLMALIPVIPEKSWMGRGQ